MWEYLLDEEILKKTNEFYYELSSFVSACDFARIRLENRADPKSIHYKTD